jgi:predicted metalloprotease with PDZ domain
MSPLEAVPDALAAAKSKRIVRWTMTGRFWMLRALGVAIAIVATTHQPVPGAQNTTAGTSPVAMTLDVDASDAPMKILHATMSIRAASGPMSLFYPKWIPGEHMASGPIANLTGLHIFADNRELDWRRDLVEMNAFAITVPAGAKTLTAKYDYAVATSGGAFGTLPSANAKIAVINWYTVGLYPMGENPSSITVTATLKTPGGWKHGGSLDVASEDGNMVHYAPTTLEMLNDHPVLLGEHFRSITLWPANSPVGEHVIDVVADSEWALQFPQSRIDIYKRIVLEERAVFGGVGHYRKYHWLLTLSDNLGSFGVEHHECADDRVAENTFVDDDAAKRSSLLLPHEFFHSWNGKARRPIGLVTGGYEKPMKDDLLWVYEGLTNYYGELLAARAGLISPGEWFDEIAADAMNVSAPGRSWRPLQDAADSSPFLYTAGGGWLGWRRQSPDGDPSFYDEGTLIWLEADVTIRKLTNGRKSLDDFCAMFHGLNDNGKVWVKAYDADDVYRTLNTVAAYDWKAFFEKRLQSKSIEIPLGGVEAGGFRFVYNENPNIFTDPWALNGSLNAYGSLGIHVGADGTVDDGWPGWPAYAAGISNGMKIIAVNGRRFSVDEFKRTIAGSKDAQTPMELIADNASYFKVVRIDYHGGLRYPHLERIAGTTDVLTTIATRRVQ